MVCTEVSDSVVPCLDALGSVVDVSNLSESCCVGSESLIREGATVSINDD